MNKEEYIASGMLELYAAGGLSAAERSEVEQMAASSPEIRLALNEACAAMESYAHLHAVQPRAALKNRIMNSIAPEASPAATQAPHTDEPPVYPMYADEKETSPYRWMVAASIALLLLSGFMSYTFYQRWQNAEERLATALANEQRLNQSFATVSERVEQQEQTLQILRDPAYTPVRLQGVEAHPESNVIVYWNPKRQQVYLDAVQLPAPPAGQQYQLWALFNGKPIDAGMLALNAENSLSLQQMKNIASAQAFAITLEPAGGSVGPTLEQLYVMGEVKS